MGPSGSRNLLGSSRSLDGCDSLRSSSLTAFAPAVLTSARSPSDRPLPFPSTADLSDERRPPEHHSPSRTTLLLTDLRVWDVINEGSSQPPSGPSPSSSRSGAGGRGWAPDAGVRLPLGTRPRGGPGCHGSHRPDGHVRCLRGVRGIGNDERGPDGTPRGRGAGDDGAPVLSGRHRSRPEFDSVRRSEGWAGSRVSRRSAPSSPR
jgi:hypothetical protein